MFTEKVIEKQLLTVRETAKILGISERSIYNRIHKGSGRRCRIGWLRFQARPSWHYPLPGGNGRPGRVGETKKV